MAGGPGTTAMIQLKPQFEQISRMVSTGLLGGVSLTHSRDADGNLLPLELTLTSDPARPNAQALAEMKPQYIGSVARYATKVPAMAAENTQMDTTAAEEAPAPSRLEMILESLPQEDRERVTTRFAELIKKAEEAVTNKDAAEKKLKEVQEAQLDSETDKQVTLAKLDELSQWFNANQAPDIASALTPARSLLENSEANPAALHVLNRTVTACNSFFKYGLCCKAGCTRCCTRCTRSGVSQAQGSLH